uniref:Ribosomal protein L27a n=1 Tax=Amorphochlora amoebiformis TaxID=1561963 RepID=A0A0H5BLE0_9EUKA|nr:ribosomal protein L27a [Amorphochlora amoebiformis]|mmetsp:Transcript_19987/g.31671  ORF Transcript_19987/g.31671 Transcript_19987/m.31671 type:complete len:153 (+) Transcript_19987:788-1246(+)
MVTRLKSTRKHRGKVSSGFGRVGRHRKHPSGRGKSGGQHHHKTNFTRYHFEHFGKIGYRFFNINKNKHSSYLINIKNLNKISILKHILLSAKLGIILFVVDSMLVNAYKLLGRGAPIINNFIIVLKKYSKKSISKIISKNSVAFIKVTVNNN